jgi:hypothetical protein
MSELEMGRTNRYYKDRGIDSQGLRDRLKACKTSICECIMDFIMNAISSGHDGLAGRFARMMDSRATVSGIPGHRTAITGLKNGLSNAIKAYEDNGCHNGPGGPVPQAARDLLGKKIPTQADWEAEHGRPMPPGEPAMATPSPSPRPTPTRQPLPPDGSTLSWTEWEYWEELTGLTGAALLLWLLWQGTRVYPPRNLIWF